MFYGITPPKDTEKLPKAVGCFLEHSGRFLLLERTEAKEYPGLWQLPGGKLLGTETPDRAMHRALWEETGLTVSFTPTDVAEVVYLSLEKTDAFAYYLFRSELTYGSEIKINPALHTATRWFTPEEALSTADLFPHTDDCIRLLYHL